METGNLVLLAWKLLSWMRHNKPDEREPSIQMGPDSQQQALSGTVIAQLCVEAKPVDDADRAALRFAATVLKMYETHEHAVAYVPTPKELAGNVSRLILGRLDATEPVEAPQLVDPPVLDGDPEPIEPPAPDPEPWDEPISVDADDQ